MFAVLMGVVVTLRLVVFVFATERCTPMYSILTVAISIILLPTAPAAPLDMSTLQALALAKAQALSLALKSSTAVQSASVSAPSGSSADGKTEAEKLKSLVDKIPTER